jgi:hypothetical protein
MGVYAVSITNCRGTFTSFVRADLNTAKEAADIGWEEWLAAMYAEREHVDLVEGAYAGDGEPVLTVCAIDGWHGESETVTEAEEITARET